LCRKNLRQGELSEGRRRTITRFQGFFIVLSAIINIWVSHQFRITEPVLKSDGIVAPGLTEVLSGARIRA